MTKGIAERIAEVFSPQAPLWACELTSKHVVVAGVNKQRTRIEGQLAVELAPGAIAVSQSEANIRNLEAARASVKEALAHVPFKGSEIAVVVPDDTARIAFLSAEKLSKNPEEQRTFIRWKLKKTVPFDVDSAQVAFHILGPNHAGSGIDMIVALSPYSIVQEYENLFASLDLQAGMVVPSTLAALNLFEPPPGDSMFLKVTPDCITTAVFQKGRIQFYRRVTNVSLYDAAYPTVMYYQDKLGGKAIEQLFICGCDSDMRPAVDEVQEKLGLAARRLEPGKIDDIFKPALGSVHLSWHSLI